MPHTRMDHALALVLDSEGDIITTIEQSGLLQTVD